MRADVAEILIPQPGKLAKAPAGLFGVTTDKLRDEGMRDDVDLNGRIQDLVPDSSKYRKSVLRREQLVLRSETALGPSICDQFLSQAEGL